MKSEGRKNKLTTSNAKMTVASRVTITDLQQHIFNTIEGLQNDALSVDKAGVIAELGKVLIDAAKVEIVYAKLTDQDPKHIKFFESLNEPKKLLPPSNRQ